MEPNLVPDVFLPSLICFDKTPHAGVGTSNCQNCQRVPINRQYSPDHQLSLPVYFPMRPTAVDSTSMINNDLIPIAICSVTLVV